MKVLIPLDIPETGIEMMRNAGLEVTTWNHPYPMAFQNVIKACQKHDALIAYSGYPIDGNFFDQCPRIKVVAQYAAGYDNVDVPEATRHNIPIGNTPGAMSDATADIAFTLLLCVARKVIHTYKKIPAGEWKDFNPKAHLGMELKNKTLGIFGLGRIGMEMALRCQGAYQMKILYYNRKRNPEAELKLNASKVDFDTLLSESDIISVHSVLSEETAGIFDKSAFKQMKSSSIFINTARGPIHNEKDLIRALKEGEIWGAGLDVTDPEPMLPDNPLLSMETVAVVPHIGSATYEARNAMSRMAAENIIAFSQGKKLPYSVNPGI